MLVRNLLLLFCLCRAEFKIQFVAHFWYLVLNFKSVFYIQSSICTKSAFRNPQSFMFQNDRLFEGLNLEIVFNKFLSKSRSLRASPRNRDSCSFIFVSNNSLHFEWSLGYGRFDCICDLGLISRSVKDNIPWVISYFLHWENKTNSHLLHELSKITSCSKLCSASSSSIWESKQPRGRRQQ